MGILYSKLMYMITTEMTITLENCCCHKRFISVFIFSFILDLFFLQLFFSFKVQLKLY